jgi:Ca2+-dependent lipid-binding protein
MFKNNLKNMGKVYVQMKYLERGTIDDEKEPEMKVELPDPNKGKIDGTLVIFLVHCKNLLIGDDDSSDPFVEFETVGGKATKSTTIENSLNPVWKKKLFMDMRLDSVDLVQMLKVVVSDHDSVSGNDELGNVEIDIKPCFDKRGEYAVNKIYDLKVPLARSKEKCNLDRAKNPSQIYLQIKFLDKGQMDPAIDAPLLEDLTTTLLSKQRNGKLIIKILHAKGLLKTDTGLKGGGGDPYVKFYFPNKNSDFKKTTVKEDTLLPQWKEDLTMDLRIEDIG